MSANQKWLYAILIIILGIGTAGNAYAVPPPDFIFNAGSQIAQIFSLVFLFLSAAFGTVYQYIKVRIVTKKAKVVVIFSAIYLMVFVSIMGAYLYNVYSERRAYLTWLKMSQEQTKLALETSGVTSTGDRLEPLNIENGWIDNNLDKPEVVDTVSSTTFTLAINNEYKIVNSAPTTTNAVLSAMLKSGRKDYLILDAREDAEYEMGHFPNSLHIRTADLRAGRWKELPINKTVYVLCWSGIRGLEVAQFLRTKNILAIALENGAEGWVADGGEWQGEIMFSKVFSEEKYSKLFSTADVKNLMLQGVVFVDSREPYKYDQWHIPNTINISLIYTATSVLEEKFAEVPVGAKVITVCDAYVNCFDAKLTGVELEKRGHEFLGRYNTPWELK